MNRATFLRSLLLGIPGLAVLAKVWPEPQQHRPKPEYVGINADGVITEAYYRYWDGIHWKWDSVMVDGDTIATTITGTLT